MIVFSSYFISLGKKCTYQPTWRRNVFFIERQLLDCRDSFTGYIMSYMQTVPVRLRLHPNFTQIICTRNWLGGEWLRPYKAAETRGRENGMHIWKNEEFKLLRQKEIQYITVTFTFRNCCYGQPLWLLAPGSWKLAASLHLYTLCTMHMLRC